MLFRFESEHDKSVVTVSHIMKPGLLITCPVDKIMFPERFRICIMFINKHTINSLVPFQIFVKPRSHEPAPTVAGLDICLCHKIICMLMAFGFSAYDQKSGKMTFPCCVIHRKDVHPPRVLGIDVMISGPADLVVRTKDLNVRHCFEF